MRVSNEMNRVHHLPVCTSASVLCDTGIGMLGLPVEQFVAQKAALIQRRSVKFAPAQNRRNMIKVNQCQVQMRFITW